MAGVKGKSGGPRKNSGPKSEISVPATDNPVDFLLGVMNDAGVTPQLRVRAAIAAAQYRQSKKGDIGKREDQANAAKKAGGGRFAPGEPPKLAVVKNP